MLWFSARWAGIIVVAGSACGGATTEAGRETEAEGGAAMGGAPTGGAATAGAAYGGTSGTGGAESVLSEAGSPPEGGAGGAPRQPSTACQSSRSDFEWDGPFALTFSDAWLSRQWWTDDGPLCTVLASDTEEVEGKQQLRIGLACTTDGAPLGEVEATHFDLSIDFGRLPASSWKPLEPGSLLQLQYGYISSIFRPIQHFLLVATDETPGFDAGAPVLGGFDGSEFHGKLDLGPVAVSLGPALCTEPGPFECVEMSKHGFIVTFQDEVAIASPEALVRFDTKPPLAFEVTSNLFYTQTGDSCCFDCEDDWVTFGIWALPN